MAHQADGHYARVALLRAATQLRLHRPTVSRLPPGPEPPAYLGPTFDTVEVSDDHSTMNRHLQSRACDEVLLKPRADKPVGNTTQL